MLGLAYNVHEKSIIYRREYSQLQAIIERSRELFSDVGRYNGQTHVWRFFERGNTLELGAFQHPGDEKKYVGRPHDLAGYDEIPDVAESQFRHTLGWVRTTNAKQRVRVVCAGNPPTDEAGAWVKRYWAPWIVPGFSPAARPGELLWYTTLRGEDYFVEDGHAGMRLELEGEVVMPVSRSFIPASLKDNAYYDERYAAQLQGLPEPLRSQLLYGDMLVEVAEDPWRLFAPDLLKRMVVSKGYVSDTQIQQAGLDVARGGSDETVLTFRSGSLVLPQIAWPGKVTTDGPRTAALVVEQLRKFRCVDVPVVVDVIGVGSAVYDALRGMLPHVYAFVSSEKSAAMDRSKRLPMRNKRAEGHWTVREWLDDPDSPLFMPDNQKLKAELLAVRWDLTPQGILIESKDKLKERLGRSPDYLDSLIMACINLSATNWKGLLEFAKEELARTEKDLAEKDKRRGRGAVVSKGGPAPPLSALELMERFGSSLN